MQDRDGRGGQQSRICGLAGMVQGAREEVLSGAMVTLFEDEKKKKTEQAAKAAEQRRAELEAVIKAGTRGIELPGKAKMEEYTTEYKQFLKEVKAKPMGKYERAAALPEKILPIKTDEKFGNIKTNAEVG